MNTLYFIGNGVDLAFGLNTRYIDFIRWLKKNNNGLYGQITDIYPDENHDIFWSNFENNICLVKSDGFDEISRSISNDISLFVFKSMKSEMMRWATEETGRLAELPKDFLTLDKNDLIFDFNYTGTFTVLYSLDPWRVFHVHGNSVFPSLFGIDADKVELGHGKYPKRALEIKEKEAYEKFVAGTFKNPEQILKQNPIDPKFLDELPNIHQVVVAGCSFSEIDFPYFDSLLDKISKKCKITLCWHSNDDQTEAIHYSKRFEEKGFSDILLSSNNPEWCKRLPYLK